MNNLKNHLRLLHIVIIIAQIYFIFSTIGLIFTSIAGVFEYNSTFTETISSKYFKQAHSQPEPWVTIAFSICLASLQVFLLRLLKITYDIVESYRKEKYLTSIHSKGLNDIGKGFDYYGYLYYVLVVVVGVFGYTDFSIILSAFPYALLFVILGKIILVLSVVSQKGETLKQENDLTI